MKYPLSKAQFAIDVALPVLSIVAVVLRFIARRKKNSSPVLHDWVILLSLIVTLGACAAGIYVDVKDIFGTVQQDMNPKEWDVHQKFLFADVLLCHTIYAFIKVSVLLFYKSIFATPRFRWVVHIMLALVMSWWISATLCHVFSGNPVSSYWTVYLPWKRAGLDYEVWLSATAVLDIALDLATLCLPLSMIRRLHIRPVRKVQLLCIFSLGAFCVVSSAIRFYWTWQLYLLFQGKLPPAKITEIVTENSIWSHVEANTSIIAACLPTLAPLFAGTKGFDSLAEYFRSFRHLIRATLYTVVRRSNSGSAASPREASSGSDLPAGTSRRWYQIGKSVLPTHSDTFFMHSGSSVDTEKERDNVEDSRIFVKTRFSAHSSAIHEAV